MKPNFVNEKPDDYVRRLAREKAEAVAGNYEDALILGADTIVVIDDKIIGKPKDFEDARQNAAECCREIGTKF